MSSEWDQTCLVCCAKTENRCSSCAEAGIDLFFCSRDHQKLVWKAHRRVCGPGKANPFMWPLLSQLEADELVKHMHESTGGLKEGRVKFSTVAEAIQITLKLSPEEVPFVLKYLTDSPSRSAALIPSRDQQLVLAFLRAYEGVRQEPVDTLFPAYEDAISGLATNDFLLSQTEDYGDEPWRTMYRHMTLIHLVLAHLWLTGAGPAPIGAWLDRMQERESDFLRVRIAPTHPELSQRMLAADRVLEMSS